MPQSVPTPVAAALGLVPAVFDGVRRLPGRTLQLPVLAVGSALASLEKGRREYDELAARGERLIARLRGASFDELEDRVEDRLQGTPLARPYDAVEDAIEDATDAVAGTVSDLTGRVAARTGRLAGATQRTVEQAADTAGELVDDAADAATAAADRTADAAEDAVPADEQPKGEPTPAATQPDNTRISTAASAETVATVERTRARAGAPTVLEHDDLPLRDYDHMTLGSLRGRLRSLTVEQLVQVRDYEKAHADRLPVVTMLDNRIAKLATDGATRPSGQPSTRPAPGQTTARGGSKVGPSGRGPAQNPPSHGDPTNPAQPR